VAETAALLQPVLWPGTGDWLAQRPAVADEALFLTRRATPFTVRGLQDRVKHYAVQAGLPPEQVSCHRLRHTLRQAQGRLFARRMAEAQMPLPSLSHWLGHSQLKTTQVYIDGASPEVRADYQAAMARLAQQAERPPSPPAAVAPPIATAESSAETTTAETAQLTAAEIESPIAQLPAWLQCPIVAFLQAQQMRWQPYHRRSRARQWLGELRRAWTWLCAERQLTGWAALRRSDLSAYLTYCREQGLSNGTINHFLTTFWAFLHFVEAQGEPITPGLYRVPRPLQPDWQPRPLSEAEYARLVRAVTTTTARDAPEAAARDRCWFLILSEGGLRISELVTLTMADWDAPAQTLTIHQGKNGHERRIPISERTAQAIESHLAGRPYEPKAPLVIHRGQAVRADYIRERLHAFAAQAQLEGITPHRLRHTYATRLLNGGGIPITTLQKLLGHRRIDTTMLYTAIYDQTLQRDYAAAVAHLQAQSQPDANWDPWSPVVEEALARTSTTPTPTPEPVTTANCM
jgi:integrase/recombinase XerD